jgi:formylglycine-generating enzyme required for sulfatase activity
MSPRCPLLRAAVAVAATFTAGGPGTRPTEPPPPSALNAQTIKVPFGKGREGIEFPGPMTIDLLQLPAGRITLTGTEREVKAVWMSRTEVTWEQFDMFWQGLDLDDPRAYWRGDSPDAKSRPSRPYAPPDANWGHRGYPAMGVHFHAVRQYLAWLGRRTGHKFRLPTEAEWEYACRAGEPAPAGPKPAADAKALGEVAWFAGNSNVGEGDDASPQTHPVAKKRPNAWGFYDMLGNVAEYVVADPDDKLGVAAGGSFQDEAADVHPAAREPYSRKVWQKDECQEPPSVSWLSNGHHIGFRLVMEE